MKKRNLIIWTLIIIVGLSFVYLNLFLSSPLSDNDMPDELPYSSKPPPMPDSEILYFAGHGSKSNEFKKDTFEVIMITSYNSPNSYVIKQRNRKTKRLTEEAFETFKLNKKLELIKPVGNAVVYCPPELIKGQSTIILATISKDSLNILQNKALNSLSEDDNSLDTNKIRKDFKSTPINIYENMKVSIEYDKDVIKLISGDSNLVQNFEDINYLEWKWQIKPLATTRKSYISFNFYYVDESNNIEKLILTKQIYVAVTVDGRGIYDKCLDFLYESPQFLIGTIIIPIITFIVGLIIGKKKEKEENEGEEKNGKEKKGKRKVNE